MTRCFQQYAKIIIKYDNIKSRRISRKLLLGCGNLNYACFFITVPAPKVTGSDISAIAGSDAILTCSVSNLPNGTTVTYQWKRDGMLVATSAMYQVSSSVGVSDAGVYICEVTVSDSANNPHVIPRTDSVILHVTVTGE